MPPLKPAFVTAPYPKCRADLLVVGDRRRHVGRRVVLGFQGVQTRVADGGEEAGIANIDINIAAVDPACEGIVVQVPTEASVWLVRSCIREMRGE